MDEGSQIEDSDHSIAHTPHTSAPSTSKATKPIPKDVVEADSTVKEKPSFAIRKIDYAS